MIKIYRYTVPIDGKPHKIATTGVPLHVACRTSGEVEFWAEFAEGATLTNAYIVVGTGHPIPDGAQHVGTTLGVPPDYVWHLYVMSPDGDTRADR